jgi:hypothetical protein
MTTTTYTKLHMEAATCLWEAMIEANTCWWASNPENPARHHRFTPVTSPNLISMCKLWDNYGTVEMRHAAIDLADFMLKVWDVLTEDEKEELIPYDWEFVPAFLRAIHWAPRGGNDCPTDPREMADMILLNEREAAR